MKPEFMDQLLQLRNLLKTFELVQNNFVISLSRKDALDLLEYNALNEFNFKKIEDFEGCQIYGFIIRSVGISRKTFIEILN